MRHFSLQSIPLFQFMAIVPTALMAIFVGSFLVLSFGTSEPIDDILDEHVSLYALESSAYQRLTYIGLLGTLATMILVVLLRQPSVVQISSPSRFAELILALVGLASLVVGAWERLHLIGILLALAFCAFLYFASRWISVKRAALRVAFLSMKAGGLAKLFAVASLLLLWCFPLISPLKIANLTDLRWIESHYAATVLPGFDMISGDSQGTIQRANYGIGMPTLVAGSLYAGKFLGYPEMGLVTVVKFYQLIAIVLIGAILLIQNRRLASVVFLVAVAFSAFTLSGVGMAIGIPNQSGVRYIPMLLGILCFALELRRDRPRVIMLSSISATVTVFSPETGLALTAGLLATAVLAHFNPGNRVASLLSTVAAFVATFMLVAVFLSVILVKPTLSGYWNNGLEFLAIYGGGGYGGLVDRLSVNAVMFFLVASCVLVQVAVQVASGQSRSPKELWQAGIATIMLIWIYYYVNRMAEWNLWFEWILLCMLFCPSVSLANLANMNWMPGVRGPVIMTYILCLGAGQACYSSWHTARGVKNWLEGVATCHDVGNMVRDTYVEGWRGSSLARQFRSLKRYRSANPIVLSGFPRQVYRMGFNEGFPWYDVPTEVVFKKDLPVVAEWLDKFGPDLIVVESHHSVTSQVAPQHTHQIWLHLAFLKEYAEDSRHDGWVIFRRTSKHDQHRPTLLSVDP